MKALTMKIKVLTIAVVAGFLSLSAHAGFEQFAGPTGEMNIFEDDGFGYPAFYISWSEWGVADLQSITSDNITFELLPNINGYAENEGDPLWRNNAGAGPDGGAYLEATTLFRVNPMPADFTNATFEFTVDANDLDPRYSVQAFLRVRENYDYWYLLVEDQVTITTPGTYNLNIPDLSSYGGLTLDAGFQMNGLNANPSDDWGSVTVTINQLDVGSSDTNAPVPDPMTFVSATAISDVAIEVVATTATDAQNGVQYSFTNFTAGSSSGWQSSPTWIDYGPAGGTIMSEMALVNHDFATNLSGWVPNGPELSGWLDDGGNGFAYMTVPSGSWEVLVQTIDLTTTPFTGGDTIDVAADIKALGGLNNGGAQIKLESWAGAAGPNNVFFYSPLTTDSWATYSTSYTMPAGTDELRIVLVVADYIAPATTSSYGFDNIAVSGETTLGTGLDPLTAYTYYVQARDTSANLNETGWSNPGTTETTPAQDELPPTPATMSFVSTNVSPATVKLTAVTATDVSSVEYYFTCTAGAGNNSGWQSSPIYYDTGLVPGSNYSYTVIARDLALAMNSNTVSAVQGVTTLASASGSFSNALTGFTGSTADPDFLFELEKAGLTTGSLNPDATIDFDANGATFGDGLGASGRNVLKTIASGYQGVSFEAYATLTFSGSNDLSGFIGMGQGLITGVPENFGVPELNLAGGNGVVAQFKDSSDQDPNSAPDSNLFKFIGGNPDISVGGTNLSSTTIGSIDTVRAKLTYDAAAETVNVSYDTAPLDGNYDTDMGTVSTTNTVGGSMWDDAPVRVYAGGGEGTVVKDFEIVVAYVPTPTNYQYYVDASQLNDLGDGTSWATAKQTIQAAVDLTIDGDTVLVTNGYYSPSAEITVTNDITVKSVNGPNVTTVLGPIGTRCFNLGSNACLVSGFTIQGGIASGADGGGVYCSGSQPVVSNCVVNGNSARRGGGVYLGTAINCSFISNNATAPIFGTSYGGGMYGGTAINCSFISNDASVTIGAAYGGGMYGGTAVNCTVVSNFANGYGGGMAGGKSYNSISWNNAAPSGNDFYSVIASNSCSPDVTHGDAGNITSAPLFADEASGNYRLAFNSPCIDAGSNAYVYTATDLDGNPRIVGSNVDMGAYEYDGPVDSDLDDLTNEDEINIHGTDPFDPDSDDDGLTDGEEVLIHFTDPNDDDSDNDALLDGDEVSTHGTNPLDADSDDDGLSDGNELPMLIDPLDADTDDDGLHDGLELGVIAGVPGGTSDGAFAASRVPFVGTDPAGFVPDADAGTVTDPLDNDSDNDGLSDGVEDANGDGAVDTGETDPVDADSDDDGLSDGIELPMLTDPLDADTDGDGLHDGLELGVDTVIPGGYSTGAYLPNQVAYDGTDPAGFVSDADPGTVTDPRKADSDNDLLSDGDEDVNGDGAVDTGETNPNDDDSDDDGLKDGDEVGMGFNPLYDESYAVDYLLNNSAEYGLYTSNSIMDLDMGYLMLQTTPSNTVYLWLQLEQTTNLVEGVWSNIYPAVYWEALAPEGKSFFRVRGGP